MVQAKMVKRTENVLHAQEELNNFTQNIHFKKSCNKNLSHTHTQKKIIIMTEYK